MKLEVIEFDKNERILTGKCEIGVLKCVLQTKQDVKIGEVVFCEFNIKPVDRKQICVTKFLKSSVKVENDIVVFCGFCESVDDIYYIRFSVDWLEMLDVLNDDKTIKEGDFIEIKTYIKNILAYKYDMPNRF